MFSLEAHMNWKALMKHENESFILYIEDGEQLF